jgi:nucleotide-binding universal stress UspA family protein
MYYRILAPLDGSKMGECSLNHIKDIASGCHVSEVVLLSVIEPLSNSFFWPSSETQVNEIVKDQQNAQKQSREKAENYLTGVATNLKLAGFGVQTMVIEAKPGQQAADVILDYAVNNDADLIIMSTHGRSGISRWAFGSVAEKVVRHATVPVLTVTPEGCRLPESPAYYAKL